MHVTVAACVSESRCSIRSKRHELRLHLERHPELDRSPDDDDDDDEEAGSSASSRCLET